MDVFKTSTKKGYSNTDFNKVLKHVGLTSKFFGARVTEPPKSTATEEDVMDLAKALRKIYLSIGPPTVGNEATKCEFISPFMYTAVASLDNDNISLEREEEIGNDQIKGPVEYFVVYKNTVVNVVEAKKDNWDQGRAQLLMQLCTAYENNINNNRQSSLHKIYGAVCTGSMWEFISYSKQGKWIYHGQYKPFPSELASPPENYAIHCREVLEILRGTILDAISETISDIE